MPKPDKVLRSRPLKEVNDAVARLKRVVLFHPRPIVEALPAQYCVCRKGEHLARDKVAGMIQCDGCFEWFHFACVHIPPQMDVSQQAWTCEWCNDEPDKEGYQRWRSDRVLPKKRHVRDAPRRKGAQLGQSPPPRYSAPADWEGKVAEVQELARRVAIKKRKLTEAAEQLLVENGHHLTDAEGMAGLEARAVDDALVDEMLGAGLIREEDDGDSD
jgi:PHD-finger